MDRDPHDRIRAWASGELSPEEVARLEAELAREPELAAFAAAYRAVHGLTDVPPELLPASATRFEDLRLPADPAQAPAIAPRDVLRRVAAAAAAVLLALVAWRVLGPAPRPAPLVLATIPLTAGEPGPLPEPLVLPALAADYRSVEDGTVRWLHSLEEARAEARLAERPLLVLWGFPGCPVCREITTSTINQEGVLTIAEMYVPVELDLTRVEDEARARELMGPGYPYIEVLDPDGGALHRFTGSMVPEDLREDLEQGLWERPVEADPPAWDDVHAAVELYERARAAEEAERFGEAHAAYGRLGTAAAGRIFEDAARDGLARLAAAARRSLLACRAVAGAEPGRAEELLREAVARFEGTPFAADLAQVLERLRATGRFPELLAPEGAVPAGY